MCTLARAMQEAHDRGVIHRDLKPSNVMMTGRGEPVIMDFGLARRDEAVEARLTKTGAILGTPAFMAPEQIEGNPDTVGPACDIYSLGVILYELLTARLPFSGSVIAMLGKILRDPPEPPSKHRPDLDSTLEAICLKAMAKRPQDRYASMADFGLRAGGVPQPSAGDRDPGNTEPGLGVCGTRLSAQTLGPEAHTAGERGRLPRGGPGGFRAA